MCMGRPVACICSQIKHACAWYAVADLQHVGAACCLQHADRVVAGLACLFEELPHAWEALQNGPLQTQADFTQLMLDLRK